MDLKHIIHLHTVPHGDHQHPLETQEVTKNVLIEFLIKCWPKNVHHVPLYKKKDVNGLHRGNVPFVVLQDLQQTSECSNDA